MIISAAVASCKLFMPSEYAFHDDSVSRAERYRAGCRTYSSGLGTGVMTEEYIHCDGTQLRLTDSDLGSEQYRASDYYMWSAGSGNSQLLFIFPTRVNLTTITLHYYSDSERGLPRLRFYAVPDNFDIWEALSASYSYIEVAALPLGGQAGLNCISTTVRFYTKKVLMIEYGSTYQFEVSEVEFFSACKGEQIYGYSLHVITTQNVETANTSGVTSNTMLKNCTRTTTATSATEPSTSFKGKS